MQDRCEARPDRRCCPHVGIRRFRCCHCGEVIAQTVRRAPPSQPRAQEPRIKAPRPREYFLSDAVVDSARTVDEQKHRANRMRG